MESSVIIIDCHKEPYQDLTVKLLYQMACLFNFQTVEHYCAPRWMSDKEHIKDISKKYSLNHIMVLNTNLDYWAQGGSSTSIFGVFIIQNDKNPQQDFSEFIKYLQMRAFL